MDPQRPARGITPPHGLERPRGGARPFLGIHFDCCHVYARIYRTREGDAYAGRCPRCLRWLRVRIGADGVASRFFRAI